MFIALFEGLPVAGQVFSVLVFLPFVAAIFWEVEAGASFLALVPCLRVPKVSQISLALTAAADEISVAEPFAVPVRLEVLCQPFTNPFSRVTYFINRAQLPANFFRAPPPPFC